MKPPWRVGDQAPNGAETLARLFDMDCGGCRDGSWENSFRVVCHLQQYRRNTQKAPGNVQWTFCPKLHASVWVFNDSISELGNERNDEAPIIFGVNSQRYGSVFNIEGDPDSFGFVESLMVVHGKFSLNTESNAKGS